MNNIITKINTYFIADEDEHIPASDFVWFYGFMIGVPLFIIAILLIA